MRTPLLVALPLVALLGLTGCSDDDADPAASGSPSASAGDPAPVAAALPGAPAETAFAEGTCRAVAPDVLALGAATARLGDGPLVEAPVSIVLRDAQGRLSAVAETAEPALRPFLDRLVTTTGGVRLRADGNTYAPEIGAFMRAAYDAVVAECTRPRPTGAAAPATTPAPTPSSS